MSDTEVSTRSRGLVVAVGADEKKQQAVYSFSRDGEKLIQLDGPPLQMLQEFGDSAEVLLAFSSQQSALMELAARFADPAMIPPEFVMNIPPDEGTLVIDPVCPHAAAVPWSLLPLALGLSDLTVVQISKAEQPHVPPKPGSVEDGPVEVLIVGCAGARYPAIARQLNEVKRRFGDRLLVQAASVPAGQEKDPLQGVNGENLLEKAANTTILHLAWPNAELPDPASRSQRASSLSSAVCKMDKMRLVLTNSSNSGGICTALSKCGVVAVGWAGVVSDDLAADFALYFYQRLVEGSAPVDAVRSFNQDYGKSGVTPEGSVPFLSLPSLAAADWAPLARLQAPGGPPPEKEESVKRPSPSRKPARKTSRRAPSRSAAPRPSLKPAPPPPAPPQAESSPPADGLVVAVESFEVPQFLNPALVINGRKTIERLSIFSSQALQQARIEIECDTGAGSSRVRESLSLRQGTSPIDVSQKSFPVLYELMAKDAERRVINFTVTLSSGGKILAEATRPTQWMGVDEWLNYRECWPFIAAFVQPESVAVKKILDQAVEVLGMIGSSRDSFSGYQDLEKDPDIVRRQIKAIYLTLQKKFSLDYIAPPPPVIAGNSGHTVGQQIRFPEEVIGHKRGTCHDLALLFAACAEQARINPMVVLISGHTFFGFWKSEDVHTEFWKLPQLREEWTIISSAGGGFPIKFLKYNYEGKEVSAPELLRRLHKQGKVQFVECTCVTGSNTFRRACEIAAETIEKLKKSKLRVVVDVRRSRGTIRPIRSRSSGLPIG